MKLNGSLVLSLDTDIDADTPEPVGLLRSSIELASGAAVCMTSTCSTCELAGSCSFGS